MHSAPDFIPATVIEADTIAGDVRRLRIRPDHGFARAEPGSHCTFAVNLGGLERERSYSVVSDEGGAWTIAVRHLENGRGGSRFMAGLDVGDRLRVAPPANHFQLSPMSPDYLLIAGGIGITPILSMARSLTKRPNLRLLYGGRTRESMAFVDDLAGMLGERLTLFVENDGQAIDFPREFVKLHPEGEAYICGPNAMLQAARHAWAASGRSPALLRFETFGASGSRENEPFLVHVRDHNTTIEVPRDASLLDTLNRHGIELAQDCVRGECGLCAIEVVGEAELDHRCVFLSDEQRRAGHKICACVSRAVGEITIDTGFRPGLDRINPAKAVARSGAGRQRLGG